MIMGFVVGQFIFVAVYSHKHAMIHNLMINLKFQIKTERGIRRSERIYIFLVYLKKYFSINLKARITEKEGGRVRDLLPTESHPRWWHWQALSQELGTS